MHVGSWFLAIGPAYENAAKRVNRNFSNPLYIAATKMKIVENAKETGKAYKICTATGNPA